MSLHEPVSSAPLVSFLLGLYHTLHKEGLDLLGRKALPHTDLILFHPESYFMQNTIRS